MVCREEWAKITPEAELQLSSSLLNVSPSQPPQCISRDGSQQAFSFQPLDLWLDSSSISCPHCVHTPLITLQTVLRDALRSPLFKQLLTVSGLLLSCSSSC
ncbi:hypothetical protein AOLI_G00244420 [Acnodon oligacanthus]